MNIGIIFAGGIGTRMHSKEKPKQFLTIHNKPIIVHTLEHFQNNSEIDAIVVVCVKGWISYLNDLLKIYKLTKVKKIVEGGQTGQLSIFNGLLAAEQLTNSEECIVLIHDGVRPLISSELLSRNIECVKKYGSSVTCAVVKESIVEILSDDSIKQVVDRKYSRVAKAPQSFWLKDIIEVDRKAIAKGETNYIDSCTMMQAYGYKMHIIDGPYENIKITTPDDFYTMRAILQVKEDAQLYTME